MQNYNCRYANGSGGGGFDRRPENNANPYLKLLTGLDRRYVRNIPPGESSPDEVYGIRHKEICPELPINDGDEDECCDEAEDWDDQDDFCDIYCGQGQSKERALAAKLQSLINEEADEIDAANMYIEKVMEEKKQTPTTFREAVQMHRNRYGTNDMSHLDSELEPELVARLVQSEVEGASLRHVPPASLYGRLFPDDQHLPKIKIAAASKRRRGDVLPVRSGMMQAQEEQLIDDLDAGIVDFYELQASKPPTTEFPKPIAHEPEGNSDDILGVVHSQEVGAEVCPFKYVISAKGTMNRNMVQIRGTEPPSWFPGYMTLTSRSPEFSQLDDPKEALEKAWTSMGPSQVSSPHGNLLLGKQ